MGVGSSHRGPCSWDGCLPGVPWLLLVTLPTSAALVSWSLVLLSRALGTLLSAPRLWVLLAWLERGPLVALSSPLLTW